MIHQNLHTHTHYSDGKLPPVDYVHEAIRQGIQILGFSDHSPLPFDNPFFHQNGGLSRLLPRNQALKKQFENEIEIYLALGN